MLGEGTDCDGSAGPGQCRERPLQAGHPGRNLRFGALKQTFGSADQVGQGKAT
jgi:hypothetical protein